MGEDKDRAVMRQGRIAALVVAGAGTIWVLAQGMGLTTRWALLVDFAALGAFLWALLVAIQIWRARRNS
jgi:hypothetical protein